MSSDYLSEDAFWVPPLSTAVIEELAESFLAEVAPEVLQTPTSLNVVGLVEDILPQYLIHVVPASSVELGPRHAVCDPGGTDEINILIEEGLWEALFDGGYKANFARSTVTHEVAHAILHVPHIRRVRDLPGQKHLLNRVSRGELKPFNDSEWQAHALGACMLVPRRTLQTLKGTSLSALASRYEVSTSLLGSHMRRLKMPVPALPKGFSMER